MAPRHHDREILIEKGGVKIHIPADVGRGELLAIMEGLGGAFGSRHPVPLVKVSLNNTSALSEASAAASLSGSHERNSTFGIFCAL
jgi:hypothetical protein